MQTRLWLLIALLSSWLPSLHAADAESRDDWQVIYMSNQRVGYGRSRVTQVNRNGQSVYVNQQERRITIKRFGDGIQIVMLSTTEEAEDGRLLSFQFETKNPPAKPTRSRGQVVGSTLKIETTVDDRTTEHSLELAGDVKAMDFQERLLRTNPLKPGQSTSFKVFSPEFAKIGTITIHADEPHTVKLHDNSSKSLLKLRVSNSLLPTADMTMYVNDRGDMLRGEAPSLGLLTFGVPRDVALQALSGAELDVAVGTLVRVPNPPATLIKAKKALIKIRSKDVDLSDVIPNAAHQTVNSAEKDVVELSLSAQRIPQYVISGQIKDRRFLGETRYLQSKDRRVIEHAERAAAGSDDSGSIAARMERYVFEKMVKKNFSTALASAAEVAERMEGDCTEHACLLAAMLRAKQIPSRVAVGFVYVDKLGAFGGHMWTEAYLAGKWIPLDATLGLGGIGASHIKLTDSDLSDSGPIPVASFLPIFNVINHVSIEVVSFER